MFRYRKSESPETNYLRWLCDDVELDYDKYRDVASTLLYYIFDDHIKNDVNRTLDAVDNRYDFEKDYDVTLDLHDDEQCGLLEMMVVLARRAADVMYDAYEDDQTPYYFWIMFENLGLDKYGFEKYDHQKVVNICKKMNERKYDRHGNGGLFVVKHPPGDVKEAEIWSIMNWYLTEKYFENEKN